MQKSRCRKAAGFFCLITLVSDRGLQPAGLPAEPVRWRQKRGHGGFRRHGHGFLAGNPACGCVRGGHTAGRFGKRLVFRCFLPKRSGFFSSGRILRFLTRRSLWGGAAVGQSICRRLRNIAAVGRNIRRGGFSGCSGAFRQNLHTTGCLLFLSAGCGTFFGSRDLLRSILPGLGGVRSGSIHRKIGHLAGLSVVESARSLTSCTAHSAAVVHGAHIGDGDDGGVHQGAVISALTFVRGGNRPLHLASNTLRPQQTELLQGIDAGFKFLIGAELCGVLLHIGGDQRLRLSHHLLEIAAFKVLGEEFIEVLVVERRVFLAGKNPGQHGPGVHRPAGHRGINGIVYQGRGILGPLEAAEGQIVIPGDHGQLAVLLI